MENHGIDIPAEVVVDWIIEALSSGHCGIETRAWRSYAVDDRFSPDAAGFEEGDIQDVLAIGELEVVPTGKPETWRLCVRVEDELDDRLPQDEDAPDGPEEIDIKEFREEFLTSRRGTAEIWVTVADATSKRSFDSFLDDLNPSARPGSNAPGP